MGRFLAVNLILILMLMGCSGEPQTQTNNRNRKDYFSVREGKRLFEHYCTPCHGENGEGFGLYLGYGLEPQPPDLTAPDFLNTRNEEMLILNISEGSKFIGKSNLCPPWGNTFNDTEIEYLAKYIKRINEEKNKTD